MDYQRFAHRDAPTPVEVTYRHKQGDSSLVLGFDEGCLANAVLDETRPGPKAVMARQADGPSFEFELAPEAEWTRLASRNNADARCASTRNWPPWNSISSSILEEEAGMDGVLHTIAIYFFLLLVFRNRESAASRT